MKWWAKQKTIPRCGGMTTCFRFNSHLNNFLNFISSFLFFTIELKGKTHIFFAEGRGVKVEWLQSQNNFEINVSQHLESGDSENVMKLKLSTQNKFCYPHLCRDWHIEKHWSKDSFRRWGPKATLLTGPTIVQISDSPLFWRGTLACREVVTGVANYYYSLIKNSI